MASSTSSTTSSLQKWQIALGIGAVSALGLSYWYLKTGRKPQLKDTSDTISIDESVKDPPKDPTPLEQAQQYKTSGNEMFKKGKFDEAIHLYNKAIEACPEEFKTELATYYQNRAAAYENLKKWSSVIADCTKAIELNSRYEKALMRRAKAEEIVKDWENCLDDVTCVCLLQQFQNQTALLMADRVLKELGKKHAQEAMLNRKPIIPSKTFIKTYFSSFSEDVVYQKLTEVGDPLGQGELSGFLKAKLAFATEKYEEIIPSCTEEINSSESESPFKIEALSLRASFYFLTGNLDKALEDLTTIINTDCDVKIKVNSLIKRASIYMQNEKLTECLEDFDKAAEVGPEISDVFHHRGQVKLLMEKTNEAILDFQKAVDLNPNFSVAFVQKCYSDYRHAMQVQDVQLLMQSLANFKKGIEKFPTCVETYVLYAQVLTEKQDYEEADKLYGKALEIDSENASIYVHRGLLMLQWKGEIEQAVELMKEGIKIDDKCEFAYETLGTVEVQRGNLVVAIDLFNKAIALARSEMELTHLFSLRDAATSQLKVTTRLGIDSQHMVNK
ncbi:mitochondrial import receptor subunit TOM70 [Tribolium castaneum]|uniref:Mitochondrial import receptor subunit TOM70-like Protein n=1 Tax=Tribolium castaneum TaxID=7070 RepID=D2A1W3_TRICA|nr:PREDICTED: mitochondrial import receptor subunit TOM70 [Tribolium castaneum]EFA02076.1 Mitochondrial import receptor subunit TOM70-like Protein [Tribolium castaneum]|eukprot:XP_008191592.1 PREDICTED: mitochondrial import receptor subunit TOM70 [Tribolium castaneum]